MSDRLLLSGGTLLTMDRSVGNLTRGDVLIEQGRITEVAPSIRARGAEVIEAEDTIVMPGFVDTHRHAWHALFRNIGRREHFVPPADLASHYTADDAYAATLVGLLGAAEAGITTIVDWADVAHADAVVQAHADAGVRSVVVVAPPAGGTSADPAATAAALASGHTGPDRTIALGWDDPSNPEALAASWQAAREAGMRIHSHAGDDPGERGAVAGLHQAGLLGEDVTLVHCTRLDADDLDAIAGSGARVSLTPSVEMTAGLGLPPLQEFIDRGIRPGLGVGSELEAPGDMFAQMRAANSVQHATSFDLKLAGKGGVPNLLSTREVIRYATVDGAGAIGLDAHTGSLTPGKRADVLVLRTDRPNIAPVNDPIGAVVWGMDTSNVGWVLVGGRPLVADGELTTDVARARELATTARQRVAQAAGLLAPTGMEPA